MNLPPSPFKGLSYFGDSETDSLFFFGRERESELVAANLMASRLTVLYGPSGVGKSSLLRAGVARRLRSLVTAVGGEAGGAEVAIVDSWRDDPLLAVAAAACAPTDIPLADALVERAITSGAELYVILDQMEEYVLYHGRDGGPLAGALEDVLTRADVPVHVLLGVRDDSLADLDALKRRLPGLFGNVLRLDHLTRAAARSAIEGPLRVYAELGGPEVTADDDLVEAVLDEVAAGRIERHLSGRGLVDEESAARRAGSRRRTSSSSWSGSGRSSSREAPTSCALRRLQSSAGPSGSSRSISSARWKVWTKASEISSRASSTTSSPPRERRSRTPSTTSRATPLSRSRAARARARNTRSGAHPSPSARESRAGRRGTRSSTTSSRRPILAWRDAARDERRSSGTGGGTAAPSARSPSWPLSRSSRSPVRRRWPFGRCRSGRKRESRRLPRTPARWPRRRGSSRRTRSCSWVAVSRARLAAGHTRCPVGSGGRDRGRAQACPARVARSDGGAARISGERSCRPPRGSLAAVIERGGVRLVAGGKAGRVVVDAAARRPDRGSLGRWPSRWLARR